MPFLYHEGMLAGLSWFCSKWDFVTIYFTRPMPMCLLIKGPLAVELAFGSFSHALACFPVARIKH